MTSEEAVNNLKTVMHDCYVAFETLDNGSPVEWDADAYAAMGDLIRDTLEKYFFLEEADLQT